jgi:hypothetical protein
MQIIIFRTRRIQLYAVCQTRCNSIRKIPLLFKIIRRFSFCVCICITNLVVLFSTCKSVNVQLNCHPPISSSRVFHPLFVSQPACNPRSQPRLRCYRGNLCHIFSQMLLFLLLPLDSIIKSKRKCKSHNEAKKSCKIMTL